MLNRDVILTEYRADARNFRKGAKIYDQTLAKQHRLTHDRLGRIDARWERSSRSILATRTALAGLTGLIGGAAIVQLRSYAEEWRDVERRLQSIGVTGDAAQQSLVNLAIRTRSSVGGTAAAVQRLAKATGGDIEITTRRVETLQKLLAAGGASGSERASVSLQLGQALQSGVLSGDEFRSIRETAPVEFLDALATAAGVTRAELKGFAEDQRLTSAIVLEALDGLASTADARFGALAVSGEEAFTILNAGLVAYAGKVDESLGATAAINGAIASLGAYMAGAGEGAETMAAAIKVVGAVSLATAGSRGLGALGSALQKTTASRRADVTTTKQQVAASRALLAQRRLEKGAADERLRVAQADIRQRALQGNVTKASRLELERATRAHAKAASALTGAQTRALASTRALTVAQRMATVTTRAWTATLRVANGVMAFFGGPVGLAITGLTLFVAVMAQARSPVETLDRALASLQGTMGKLEGVNTTLASDYAALERAQDSLAEATRRGGDAAVDAATRDVAAINTRIRANEALRRELAVQARLRLADAQEANRRMLDQLARDARQAQLGDLANAPQTRKVLGMPVPNSQYLEAFNRINQQGREELLAWVQAEHERARAMVESGAATEDLTDLQQFLIHELGASELQVAQLSAELEALVSPAAIASAAIDGAAGSASGLTAAAANAQAGIAGLIAAIPQMREAQQVQEDLAQAEENYQAALTGLDKGLSGLERIEAERELADLRQQAISEISGEADAIRDADKAMDAYLDSARIGALDARNQALAREEAQYLKVVAALKEANTSQDELARAQDAYQQRVGQINAHFDEKASKTNARVAKEEERGLAAARELLVENGQKALYIEQELNAERERLQDLLPGLVEMGLSHADAQAVLNLELERTEERLNRVRSASEEAAHAFARGVLQDLRAAEDLNDAIGRISDRLLDLAFDKAFDLLAEQFAQIGSAAHQSGGSGLGGFVGSIFGALFGGGVRAATGGLINGPGTGTSDSIPAWLSNGEYVVPAQSVTPQTLPYLEALRRGPVLPRFATGGLVGGAAVAPSAAPSMRVEVHNHARSAQVEAQPSADGQSLKIMIWDTVEDGIHSGRFDRAHRNRFGNRPIPRGV